MPCAIVLGCSRTVPGGAPPEADAGPSVSDDGGDLGGDGFTGADAGGPIDDEVARELRHALVRQIETFDRPWGGGGWDPRVLDAMRRVPRHFFMPHTSLRTAYMDQPYPIGHGQTISQPTVVALMTQALRLRGDEKVLEIGTGSGYQAAVLALCARSVYSIELLAPLGESARDRLRAAHFDNVEVRIGDGYAGWPEHAPFDRIILTAAPPEMPEELLRQLADGGYVVAPVGEDFQVLERWTKHGKRFERESLGGVRFVPMVHPPE
ncbi:MAG: protein-L-isoaspartate(D-aspartate) O-methyltransferase [Polyangiaceae bacterium]|nr:protein-L-isoaspartate(D-aspartate) O-methyltransferase [Polyangiaceae bacterium]